MPLKDGEITYLNATEAAKDLGFSRQMFYQSIKPMLQAHKLGVRKNVYYREEDIKALKSVHRVGDMPIVIQGIRWNFEKYMRALGYDASVEDLGMPVIAQMNEHIAQTFNKPIGSPVIIRKRRQSVRGVHYRIVVNYYPIELAGGDILEAMQRDKEADVLELIKNKHHLIINIVHELVKARFPTQEERGLLGIRANDPIFEIKRTNYTSDKKTVIMLNELVLMAGYFGLEYEYPTNQFEDDTVGGNL